MSGTDGDVREFVKENRDLVRDVLRYSQDPYTRSCALVLLKHGATEREIEAMMDDLAVIRNEQ